ncbi:Por secretion system C-terminal sorting domain-containing protein [Nonlabens sp. Hel1_33_55]|uniref:T9SS type A sorting domain-containing protein n=1 Tax=Nonlabens sp. Hel1_33_55 TaxID=1336802 RepID=UPI000875CCB4|nr:T9SS type A sorting domain-containing protein [Nonlabens sp. Hel1_33_55]SCY14785.1 Por secretion system C-terminal sorting domain-containing protein [Nonlabens sp. Hel1_33_55]
MKKIYTLLSTLLITGAVMAQAPTLVLDINDGSSGSNPRNIIAYDGQLFFTADDSSGINSGGTDTGTEPWKSDGTAAGTSIVADIAVGDGEASNPFNVFIFNDMLYFTANDGAAELWTSDLTAAGTVKVDLFPEVTGDVPNNAVVLGNTVFLTANLPSGNNQLSEWDGTNDAQVALNSAGNEIITTATELTTYNGLIYGYIENSVDEATVGRELYSYDPISDVYTLVKDIASGDANSGISGFTVANGLLYFEAQGNLWQSDGTNTNTIEVPQNDALGMNGVNNIFNFNENILFEGDNGAGDQLWNLNTTTGTITQVSSNTGDNPDHDPSDYVVFGDFVYYSAESSSSTDSFLFRTDGVETVQLDNTIKDVDDITLLDGFLYFEGEDTNTDLGNELYVFNPATASISRVERTSVNMYPNPSTNGIVNFSGNTVSDNGFEINDLSGRMVLKGNLQNSQLKHDLKTGIYFVNLENQDNAFKLIVE